MLFDRMRCRDILINCQRSQTPNSYSLASAGIAYRNGVIAAHKAVYLTSAFCKQHRIACKRCGECDTAWQINRKVVAITTAVAVTGKECVGVGLQIYAL